MSGCLPKRLAAPQKRSDDRRIEAMLSERERLMGEIALRQRLGALPPMLAKARTLLTRFWGRSSWEARLDVLGAARLLMTLGVAQPYLQARPGLPEPQTSPSTSGPRHRKPARASGATVERR